ncbi:MAG: NAD-dependent epimerase/dehydratase family protein [Acidimicrobiales bacterium]
MIVAVTGAGGYLGSRLTSALDGHDVRALVRKFVDYLPDDQQVEIDLLSGGPDLTEALAGAGTVVHLAGLNEVAAAQDPDRALAETAIAGRHVAAAARTAGVTRLVYVSTVHVYGALLRDDAVVTEELAPEPRSEYAVARLASEHLIQAGAGDDVATVVLRLTNAVGAPAHPAVDRWSLVAADLSRQAVRDGRLVLRSSGVQWRDFVVLADVCRIIAGCATTGIEPGTYNLASGTSMTVRGLAELVQDRFAHHTGTRPVLEAPEHQGPAPRPYRVAVDKLVAQGWRAGTPLTEGIDELVRFCLDHEADL